MLLDLVLLPNSNDNLFSFLDNSSRWRHRFSLSHTFNYYHNQRSKR